MTSQDGSERPPRGTESNAIMQSFPELPDESKHHSKADANGSNKANQLMASATDYLQSMTMNEWSEILHSKENESYLLDQSPQSKQVRS